MSKLRCVNTKFWDDTYIINLGPIEKLLFLYFLTNPLTDICGIYEISLRRIGFDTGIDSEMVNKILERFAENDKIYYLDGWIYVKNFQKHQIMNESIKIGIKKSLAKIPKEILEKIKTFNTQSVPSRYPVGVKNPQKPELPNKTKTLNTRGTQRVTVGGVYKDKYKDKDKINNVFVTYGEFINSRSRLTEGAKEKIKTRLKTYSLDELLEAIKNFSQESWWMKNNSHRGIAWFFHSDDRIDQFLTLKTNKEKIKFL